MFRRRTSRLNFRLPRRSCRARALSLIVSLRRLSVPVLCFFCLAPVLADPPASVVTLAAPPPPPSAPSPPVIPVPVPSAPVAAPASIVTLPPPPPVPHDDALSPTQERASNGKASEGFQSLAASPSLLPAPGAGGLLAVPPPGSARELLLRVAPTPMGTNNAVTLWVRGDASGTVLRVRVLQTGAASLAPGDTGLGRPAWVSAPIAITFAGWRQIVLPQSGFTLRPAQAMPDISMPPDAGMPPAPAPAPDWTAADAVALDLTVPRKAALIVDDIQWAALDASGAAVAQTPVDDFETGNVGAWTLGGTRAQQQAVTYGLIAKAGAVHGGREAFLISVLAPAYRRQALLPALKKTLAATGKTVLVYTLPSLFDPVLPDSLPPAAGASSLLSLTMCPEQTQAATFCVYSQTALTNVTVTLPSDLVAPGHALARANIAVHVVKVWRQEGATMLRDPDTAGAVPELLVKDDRVPLAGPAPAVRLAGNPVTDIPADTVKQFWVTVTVPRGTPPAAYSGALMVSGRGLAPVSVPLSVTVLPLRLLSPAKQYALNLRARLDNPPAPLPSSDGKDFVTDFVTKPALDAQLADIAAHGVRIVTLSDSAATLPDAFSEYRAFGMTEPFVYHGAADPSVMEAARKAANAPALIYFVPPSHDSAARLDGYDKQGMQVTTYVARQADYDRFAPDMGVVLLSRDSVYAQDLLRTHGKRVSTIRDWWYWPAANEDPLTNRLDAGYLLWRANLYGAFLPSYEEAFGADPYDEQSAGAAPMLAALRPQMLVYPAQDGVIDTLQWEAVREGMTDVRYLTTMYAALRECKDAHIAKPLVTQAEGYAKAFLDKPLALLPGDKLDAARAQIAVYALQLRSAVDGYNKTVQAPPLVSVPARKPLTRP